MDIVKENMQQRCLEGRTLTLVCVHTGVKQLFGMNGDVTSLGRITLWKMRAACILGCSAARSKRSSCLVTVLCSGEFFFQGSWNTFPCTVTSFVNLANRGEKEPAGSTPTDPIGPRSRSWLWARYNLVAQNYNNNNNNNNNISLKRIAR